MGRRGRDHVLVTGQVIRCALARRPRAGHSFALRDRSGWPARLRWHGSGRRHNTSTPRRAREEIRRILFTAALCEYRRHLAARQRWRLRAGRAVAGPHFHVTPISVGIGTAGIPAPCGGGPVRSRAGRPRYLPWHFAASTMRAMAASSAGSSCFPRRPSENERSLVPMKRMSTPGVAAMASISSRAAASSTTHMVTTSRSAES